ncbi:MAG: hypothetical protein M3R69_13070 [Acidobacteriota bacterium]|nr:hypothetical protein [Acidobacteriota bacterium]
MSFFLNSERSSVKQLGFAAFLLLFGLLDQADAQSGRRAAKSQPANSTTQTSAAPAESPSPEETTKPAPGGLQQKVRLLVARQPTSRHLPSEDQILASFIKHLNTYENIQATSIGDSKEGRAVERAKAETEAFVILLKFDIDGFQSGTIILNSQDLQIEYSVLAPRTAKKQTKGKVYFQGIGGGRMRKSDWPNGTPVRITPDAAGIEAADGLYFWLKLATMKATQ